MKNQLIDDMKLAATNPGSVTVNTSFADRVMRDIRQSESFSKMMRIKDVNHHRKETWLMKLKQLPAIAIVAIALAVLLGLGGAVYAAYQLWPKPETKTTHETKNTSGRTQLQATMKNCGKNDTTTTYELKKNAKITKDQIAKVVQAHCEVTAIEAWANQTAPAGYSPESESKNTLVGPEAVKVIAIDEKTLTTTQHGEDTKIALSHDTQFIVDGSETSQSDIHVGDIVLKVVDNEYKPGGGWPIHQHLRAVIRLDLPLEAYSIDAFNSLTEFRACLGNPDETCPTSTGSIDIYDGSEFDASMASDTPRVLQGTITALTPGQIVLRGSSGKQFTVRTTTDLVGDFNRTKLDDYQIDRIGVGDSLLVSYNASDKQNSTTVIEQSQVKSLNLVLEIAKKTDKPAKY